MSVKKHRGSYLSGRMTEPWKDYNPNCKTCRYSVVPARWHSEGVCNYAALTGKLRGCKVNECKGVKAEGLQER